MAGLGCYLISADELGHQAIEPGDPGRVRRQFCPDPAALPGPIVKTASPRFQAMVAYSRRSALACNRARAFPLADTLTSSLSAGRPRG